MMKLKDIKEVINGEFILYNSQKRIGRYKPDDEGLEDFLEQIVYEIEANDKETIIITLED